MKLMVAGIGNPEAWHGVLIGPHRRQGLPTVEASKRQLRQNEMAVSPALAGGLIVCFCAEGHLALCAVRFPQVRQSCRPG